MIRTFVFTSALSLTGFAVLSPAFAQAPVAQPLAAAPTASRSITVAKDKSMAFKLDEAVGELVVAQPDVAEIVAKTDHSFYIRGKKAGATNVLVYGPNQQLVEVIDVRVGPDTEALRQDLASSMPGETIKVSNFADGVLLSGEVSTSSAAARAKQVALRYAPDAVSTDLSVRDPQQVILEVRIIEASRTALRDAGINLSVIGTRGSLISNPGLVGVSPASGTISFSAVAGPVSIDATLQALEDKGIIKTLAKPNLAALSGEDASFLAGGEFPFPVPSGLDQVSIQFKPFGVTLNFTPQVQDDGMIRLKVAPEVSAIDNSQGLKIDGFNVPALTERKASTTVQLAPGKSLAIAGLFQQSDITSIHQTPILGDVPILGALFKSAEWNKQETELVIIVTPRLADVDAPLPDPYKAKLDLDHMTSDGPATAPASLPVPAPTAPAATVALAAPTPIEATLVPVPVATAMPAPPPVAAAQTPPPAPVATTDAPPAPIAQADTSTDLAAADTDADANPPVALSARSDLDDLVRRLSQGPDPVQPGV